MHGNSQLEQVQKRCIANEYIKRIEFLSMISQVLSALEVVIVLS